MFIDTHMHIGDDFGVQPDLYVKNASDAHVEVLIASFCEKNDIMLSTKFVEKYKNLYACIGYHPEVSNKIVEKDYEILEEMVKNNPKIVAIGEIGLDYHWDKDNKDKQREVFCKQLEIAEKLKVPVVIHSRDSINETYEILKKYKVSGVIHCFSGSLEMAKKFISLGFLLGIGGVVTFKNSKLFEVIEKLELTNIVLETDSPYLSPVPYRGKINTSKNIPIIAEFIASKLNLDTNIIANKTTKNALSLFTKLQ